MAETTDIGSRFVTEPCERFAGGEVGPSRASTGSPTALDQAGCGASHDAAEDGGFESELTAVEGHTHSQRVDSPGPVNDYCQPHRSVGTRGVVVE